MRFALRLYSTHEKVLQVSRIVVVRGLHLLCAEVQQKLQRLVHEP